MEDLLQTCFDEEMHRNSPLEYKIHKVPWDGSSHWLPNLDRSVKSTPDPLRSKVCTLKSNDLHKSESVAWEPCLPKKALH